MSDRLQIYNKTDGTYLTIAKDFGSGYQLGNVDLLQKFFKDSRFFDDIVLVKDWEGIDKEAEDLNVTNKWEVY